MRDLLVVLGSYHEGYRLMRRRMRGDLRDFGQLPKSIHDASDSTLRATLSRLKRKGYVANEQRGLWKITKRGLNYLRRSRIGRLAHEHHPVGEKRMIIAFDIPEKQKWKREWLRAELVAMRFSLLQRSVWFGPAPLPRKFVDALVELKLLPHVKFFDAREADIV